jgi:hypothetical protein
VFRVAGGKWFPVQRWLPTSEAALRSNCQKRNCCVALRGKLANPSQQTQSTLPRRRPAWEGLKELQRLHQDCISSAAAAVVVMLPNCQLDFASLTEAGTIEKREGAAETYQREGEAFIELYLRP